MSNVLRTVLLGNRQSIKKSVTPIRNISRSLPRSEKPSVSVPAESTPASDPSNLGGVTHVPKSYHKYALVWTGKYKSMADVPERVPHGVLDAALNKARIKIAIYMMIATALAAGVAVYSGKKAVSRGEHLAIFGIEQQKKLREQGLKEEAAAKSK